MSVVSYIFIVFFAVTVLIYYIVPKKIQWWVLLAASAVFYAYSGIDDLLIVVGTAFLVYPLTMLMEKIWRNRTGCSWMQIRELQER